MLSRKRVHKEQPQHLKLLHAKTVILNTADHRSKPLIIILFKVEVFSMVFLSETQFIKFIMRLLLLLFPQNSSVLIILYFVEGSDIIILKIDTSSIRSNSAKSLSRQQTSNFM